jgi:hypothetical protein
MAERVGGQPIKFASSAQLMAEPDKEVQEALLLLQARRMNIVLDGSTHTSSMR